jgi:ubiquinone/menaquinone biosynthesis C-methylase UbiE
MAEAKSGVQGGGLETRFSGSVPENYDRGLGPHIFDHYARQMAQRCAALKPACVLETAAGTGIVTEQLAEALGPNCRLVATDLNQPMVDYAKHKLGDNDSTEYRTADGCNLPFEDNSFDAMVCQFGVMFYPDKQAGFDEALRVLKPGGTYLFNVWNSWASNQFAEVIYDIGAEFVPDDPPTFYKVPFSYHDTDEILAALGKAGFVDCNIEELPHEQMIEDPRLLAIGAVHGNPLYFELVDRGIDPGAVLNRMIQAFDERLGNLLRLNAIFVSAKRPG